MTTRPWRPIRYLRLQCPPSLPDAWECRKLSVPDSQDWLGVINSVLLEASRPEAWQQMNEGDMTPEECAAIAYQIYEMYLLSATTGECGVSCEDVINCVEGDEDTRAALLSWATSTGLLSGAVSTEGYPVPAVQLVNLQSSVPSCSAGLRYGLGLAVVRCMDRVTTDLLQVTQLILDQKDLAIALTNWIPIVGNIIEAALNAATWFIDNDIDTYVAAYNSISEEAVACAIACALDDQCSITIEELWGVYRNLLSSYSPPATGATLTEWFTWAASLTLSGDTIVVAAEHLAMLTVFRAGGAVIGWSPDALRIAASQAVAVEDPPECDCPTEWCYTFDLTASDGGLENVDVSGYPGDQFVGEYAAGVGWQQTTIVYGSTSATGIALKRAFSSVFLTRVRMIFSLTPGAKRCSNDEFYMARFRVLDGATIKFDNYPALTPAEEASHTFEATLNVTGDQVQFTPYIAGGGGCSTQSRGGTCVLESITFYGTGTNPFGTDNCT